MSSSSATAAETVSLLMLLENGTVDCRKRCCVRPREGAI